MVEYLEDLRQHSLTVGSPRRNRWLKQSTNRTRKHGPWIDSSEISTVHHLAHDETSH